MENLTRTKENKIRSLMFKSLLFGGFFVLEGFNFDPLHLIFFSKLSRNSNFNMRTVGLIILTIYMLYSCSSKKSIVPDYLIAKKDTISNSYAYYDFQGNKIIGDYDFVYTDTLFSRAIVAKDGCFLINKSGKIICEILTNNNGPDYESDGYIRIKKDSLIGFLNYKSGKIVIAPKYECATPFIDGESHVSINCKQAEIDSTIKEEWFVIDKNGQRIK